MSKSYLDLLCTSRIRPKMVAYFVSHDEPVGTRKLARTINEDVGATGHLVKEFVRRGFIAKQGTGYVLAAVDIRSELQQLLRCPEVEP